MNTTEYSKEVLAELNRTLTNVSAEEGEKLAQLVLNAGKILVAGAGRSGFAVKAFAMRLMHMGFDAYVVNETVTPNIEPGDVLVVGSGSGETGSLVVMAQKAKKIGAVDFLVQGTIYPDVIESGLGQSAVIKSHHNVGGLPSVVDFKEIVEPLRDLFKDEVRRVGFELGLPRSIVMRQPFPGPGLAIRIIGDITREKIALLQEADYIYREEIAKAGLDEQIWQYFAVLTNSRSVGVMGDSRTYDYTIALRGVTSVDGMTADWARIPYDVLEKISNRIVNEVRNINRIVYDITSKPPATIEWE